MVNKVIIYVKTFSEKKNSQYMKQNGKMASFAYEVSNE